MRDLDLWAPAIFYGACALLALAALAGIVPQWVWWPIGAVIAYSVIVDLIRWRSNRLIDLD